MAEVYEQDDKPSLLPSDLTSNVKRRSRFIQVLTSDKLRKWLCLAKKCVELRKQEPAEQWNVQYLNLNFTVKPVTSQNNEGK
jgi:hypothetical protein